MPEGDTIYKVAERLAPVLEGERLRRVELHGRDVPSLRRQVQSVRAVGKHLLLELDSGETVRVHLGMHGSWHRYAHGERWRRPQRQASLRFDTEAKVFVCFNAMRVDFLDARQVAQLDRHLELDLLKPGAEFDGARIIERARRLEPPHAPIVNVLLNQRIAAGIGNVYKNEVLFLEGTHPLTRLDQMSDEKLERLYELSKELLEANMKLRGKRRTRNGTPHLWVYNRASQPCLKCDTAIRWQPMGRGRRGTYWCDECQPRPSLEAAEPASSTAQTQR